MSAEQDQPPASLAITPTGIVYLRRGYSPSRTPVHAASIIFVSFEAFREFPRLRELDAAVPHLRLNQNPVYWNSTEGREVLWREMIAHSVDGDNLGTSMGDDTPVNQETDKPRRRRRHVNHASVIFLTGKTPKRKAEKSRKRFDLYKNGMTVKEYLDAGGTAWDLWYDAEWGGFIELKKPE
jgi:hypothetical protein